MAGPICVRYPPSPTGFCHVGTARMALLNFLFAKKNGGSIVLRIEDTDKSRSGKEYEDDITEQFRWLGLQWDEFYRQSERKEVYQKALQQLIDTGKAYISEEESKKEPVTTVNVVRLRNPGKRVTFTDIVRGEISFDTAELGDFAIARALNDALYHFTVVVDDEAMGITHVIRGEDHISNTPRQILIQEAFGFARPIYAHYPLHLASDRSKLSKRKGDVAVREYRTKGYLADALRNYLATLGWTPPSGREIMSLEEMIAEFELKDLHKSGAVFDTDKLRWYNRQYLHKFSNEEYARKAITILDSSTRMRALPWDAHVAQKIIPVLRERVSVWDDIRVLADEGELDYFFSSPTLNPTAIPGKGNNAETAKKHLAHLKILLSSLPSSKEVTGEVVKNLVWEYAEKEGRSAVLWPLRYVLTGREKSPDPFTVAAILGKKSALHRIDTALRAL